MIRTLLATTAIATLLTGGALAQQSTPPTTAPSAAPAGQTEQMMVHADGHLASNIIGEAVYNGTGEDAEDIGDVTDLVLSDDGQIQALVVGVGGFLGIGQKNVALEYNLAQWSEQPDGERRLVIQTTEDALRAQPEFDSAAYEPMPADAQVSETRPATQEDLAAAPTEGADTADDAAGSTAMAPTTDTGDAADNMAANQTDDPAAGGAVVTAPTTGAADSQAVDNQQQAAQNEQMGAGEAMTDQTQTGAIDRSTLQQAGPDQVTAETLLGTTVYGSNEENVGEIGDVVLTPDGNVDAVVVDVGGFLGIGEKQVAIGMDNLNFMSDEDGDLYLFTNFTQEQLEAQPAYEESNYAESRDQMRMQVQ